MSRRSSVSSGSVSNSLKSGLEDDPLMRDCYDLRRRLLQTEQSLQNMKPTFTSEKPRPVSRGQHVYDRKKETADTDRNYHLSPEDISNRGTARQSDIRTPNLNQGVNSQTEQLRLVSNKQTEAKSTRQQSPRQIHWNDKVHVSYLKEENGHRNGGLRKDELNKIENKGIPEGKLPPKSQGKRQMPERNLTRAKQLSEFQSLPGKPQLVVIPQDGGESRILSSTDSTWKTQQDQDRASYRLIPRGHGEGGIISPRDMALKPLQLNDPVLEQKSPNASPRRGGDGYVLSPRARLLYEQRKREQNSPRRGTVGDEVSPRRDGDGYVLSPRARLLYEQRKKEQNSPRRGAAGYELSPRRDGDGYVLSPRARLLYEQRKREQISPRRGRVGDDLYHKAKLLSEYKRWLTEKQIQKTQTWRESGIGNVASRYQKSPERGLSPLANFSAKQNLDRFRSHSEGLAEVDNLISPRARERLLSEFRVLPEPPSSLPEQQRNTLSPRHDTNFYPVLRNQNSDMGKYMYQGPSGVDREEVNSRNVSASVYDQEMARELFLSGNLGGGPNKGSGNIITGRERSRQFSPQSHNGPTRGYSSSPESAQVLTLADLTPPTSEPNTSMTQGRKGASLMGSLSQPFRSSLPDLRNGSAQSSPRDREFDNRSFGSTGDYDHDTVRKKLNRQREENSQLVNQNHKLMSELENMSYELHQAKNKVKIVTRDLEEERKRIPSLEDRIVTLESQLADQEDRSRLSDHRLVECQDELQSKTEELRSVLESSNLAESELREEARIRKRAEAQLQDAMRNMDDLTERLADQDESLRNIKRQNDDKDKQLRESLSQSQKDHTQALNKASSMEVQIRDLKEEIRLLHQEGLAREDSQTSMHQENASLRATISRQSQKIGRLENELRKNETFFKDNNEHLEIIERQRERIQQYQQEMADTKVHMARLEELVHRVQEQSIKEHMNTPPSTSDSGICNSTQTVNGFRSPPSDGSYLNGDISIEGEPLYSSPGKARALIADLKLKLALKDAEMQKLQASAVARAAAQQKHIAGLAGDGGTMDGLRSELTAIVERSRMGDRKQQELEQMITRLEDEISRYSSLNVQLEERLADKMAQVSSLEGKLGQRNLRVVDLQKELEDKISEINDLLREVRQKEAQVSHLERQLEDKSSEQGSRVSQIRELREELRGKEDEVNNLRVSMDDKNKELRESLVLVERGKTLQGEQCKEMELQIEQLQKAFEEKNLLSIQLETALTATRQELELRSTIAEQMERTIEEQKNELAKTETESMSKNKKFEDLNSQAEHATRQMQHLEKSLADCQQEIKVYIEQLEESRRQYETDMKQAKEDITKLELALTQSSVDLQQKAGYIGKLEQALSERQATLQKEQERAREMHESRVSLQQQVTLIEEEINRERNASQLESNEIHQKLQEAKADLEQKTKELNELNTTMREMHKDMKMSSASIVELEQLLQQTRSQNDKVTAQLQTVEEAYKESKSSLSQHTKRNGELEERLRQTEQDLTERDGQVNKLDHELTKLQSDFQDTITQLKSLEDLLDTSKRVVEEKEQKVTELDKMLNESIDELQQKDKDLKEKEEQLAELDKALKETRKECKTKEAQFNQLDVTMKDHQSEVKQKTMVLEQNLGQSRYELSERAVEIAELKAKYDQSQELLRQARSRLQHYEKTTRQQQDDLKKRIGQLSELEREAEKLRRRKQDSDETSQELRLSREQLQNTHGELMEARRELLRYQRREQELVQELDDAHVLLTAKEGDCTRLAKDLGAAQVREAQAEARCVQEMRKTTQQNELKEVSHEKELQRLQESYNKLLAQKEELEAEKRILSTNLKEKERKLGQELARTNDDTAVLVEENKRLTSQLALYQEDAKSLSEALVIKDAEIARLEARISGYERAMFGRNTFDKFGPTRQPPQPSSPRPGHYRHVTSPRSLNLIGKSSSDYNLHNLSTGSALSYIDTDDLLDFNHNTVSRTPMLRVTTEGSVSHSSRSRNPGHATPSKMSRNEMHDRSVTETIDEILREANRALHDDDPLLLTPTSTSRAPRHSSTSQDLSPPQREVISTGSSDESAPETLKEQLEAKKAAAGLGRSSEGTPLDPGKCRASLEERLRVSEQRRKQIDKQLQNMKSTLT